MTKALLFRRFLLVFGIAATVIINTHILRGQAMGYALKEGLQWALISSLVYTAVLAYKLRPPPVQKKKKKQR